MRASKVVIIFLFILLSFTSSEAQTKWFKYAGNPVLEKGEPGEFGSEYISQQCVLWDGSKYNMWYRGNDGENPGIGYATSIDGIIWEKYADNPVMERSSGSWDAGGIEPACVSFDGINYTMYYNGWVNSGGMTGLATSPDGIHWTKDTLNNPVLTTGRPGSWDTNGAWGAHVIYDNSNYKMWYNGLAPNPALGATVYTFSIGYAESSDGINWNKHPEPILKEGDDDTWANDLRNPFVIFEGNNYMMWYSSINTFGATGQQINYATSPDSINWTLFDRNPILAPGFSPEWATQNIWMPTVIKENNIYKMWYTGENSQGRSIGYAEDFSNLVHADSVMVDGIYVNPNEEQLNILGRVKSPEGHALTAKAMIQSDDESSKDSIELFDDGLNGDGNAGDGIYGGYGTVTNEKNYTVGIKTVDEMTSFTRNGLNWNIIDRFTSKGPVTFEDLEITSPDTITNPGDRIKFSLTLKSLGITDTVYDVDVNIIITDTTIKKSTTGVPKFGDIAPGESLTSWSSDFALIFRNGEDSCSVGLYEFGLEITSNGEVFWYDTFTIDVVTGIEDEFHNLLNEYALEQNYPNPFNPYTTLKYSIPKQSYVTLKVFDILGREVTTLVNNQQKTGYYEVEFDGSELTSGIYFYRIKAGEFVETKKMVLMK